MIIVGKPSDRKYADVEDGNEEKETICSRR